MADAELLQRLDRHLERMDVVIEEQRAFTREMLLRFERFTSKLAADWRELREELAEDRRVRDAQFAEDRRAANAQFADDRRVTNAALLAIIDRLDTGGPRPAS